MINKLYEKYIKKNIIVIIIYIILILSIIIPLPYFIDMPGGTTDINNKIEVENGYKSKGMFGFAYVSSLRATPFSYIVSLFKKDWELIKLNEVKFDNETIRDAGFRDNIFMEESFDNASIVAFSKASKELTITKNNLYVTYIDKEAKTNLKIGDKIISVNNVKVNSIDDIRKNIQENKKVKFKVERNSKIYEKTATIVDIDGIKSIGIMVINDIEFETDPKITFKKDANESGPSGGLMLSLTIYNNLVKEDITKGNKIIGTGTIDKNGIVGDIGGVSHKILGAEEDDADIFFVPEGNYEEANKTIKEHNLDIKLVKISTFDEALDYLKSL